VMQEDGCRARGGCREVRREVKQSDRAVNNRLRLARLLLHLPDIYMEVMIYRSPLSTYEKHQLFTSASATKENTKRGLFLLSLFRASSSLGPPPCIHPRLPRPGRSAAPCPSFLRFLPEQQASTLLLFSTDLERPRPFPRHLFPPFRFLRPT
jgi:hypothetical protein